MTKTLFTTFVSILAFIRALSITPASAQETAGQILAKLEKLSAEDRQKVLVERARSEKEITFYSSLQTADAEPYLKAFNKRYPFIKVNIYRISGQKQVIMIQSEFNAGRHAFDITNASAAQAFGIKKTGALDPYQSPQRQYFSSAHKDKEGYFIPTYIVPVVLGYNTNMVKRNEAPKRYEDLLEPRWKSNMILDIEEFPWFAVMLKHYGREKGLDYMKRLAKQEILMGRGRTTQAQLISAGERALGIALNSSSVVDFKTRGAPLDWTILDPYYAKPNMLMLARHAPHPHAAALLIDWTLSEEGQSLLAGLGYVVARKGVKQSLPALLEKESFLADPDFIGPILEETGRDFRNVFTGGR
ncbi:MAG: extracellular solute-binding protein [Candidatus Binatia bacterium]|jgi:iron(III) transport system substrate-binding protein